MTPTLYLTRNGLLEPLGQSQVFAYLRGLSRDCAITIITYEKPEDWADNARMAQAQEACATHGIRWLPQKFLPRPRFIAPALSMFQMTWLARREVRRRNVRLIHARSYIPAAVALIVGRMTGVPFIFDMRALWPEELVTAGRLRRGSFLHRAIAAAERACLRRAAAVVSLTHAAVDHLRTAYPEELKGQRIAVIPTCADLERFQPASSPKGRPLVHGCIGTILSGWFRTDWLAGWFQAVAARDPDARFEIVTRDDHASVRKVVDPKGALESLLTIKSCRPEEMPETVRQHDLSVMFYAGGELSELGRSPTRMAEVLGSGLPVIVNAGVGDVEKIVRENGVGVIVAGPSPADMQAALDDLDRLLADPGLPSRCRAAAEALFSLEAGTRDYARLYADILTERNTRAQA